VKVVEALVNIGQRQGVEYRMNTNISEIVLSDDGKRAKGVRLADTNEVLEADIVICNADLIYAYNNLLPETSYSRHLATRKPSCSSLSFYWALDRKFPEFSAHNIFLAEKYQESFDSIFKKQELPDEPSFYVNVPSRIDPSASPEGCDTMVVLVPVGYMLDSNKASDKGTKKTTVTQDWDAMVATARRSVLRIIETRLKISLEDHIKHESVNTPPSWNERFNLDRGAILGLSHDFFNVLAFRPKTKHPSISDLFFVGASTHPGTGVPIVLAGAKLVSEQILEERGVSKPWLPAIQSQGRGEMSELDRSQWWPWIEWFNWFLMGLSALFAWAVYLLVKSVGALDWSKGSTRMLAGDW
jgi:phytoene desaturase (3,4-didehydrolycopene-forming)